MDDWEERSYVTRLNPSPCVREVLEVLSRRLGEIIAATAIKTAAARLGSIPNAIGPTQLQEFIDIIINETRIVEIDELTRQELRSVLRKQ